MYVGQQEQESIEYRSLENGFAGMQESSQNYRMSYEAATSTRGGERRRSTAVFALKVQSSAANAVGAGAAGGGNSECKRGVSGVSVRCAESLVEGL